MILRDRDANATGGWAGESDGVPFGLPQGDGGGDITGRDADLWNANNATTLGWDALSEDADDGLGNRQGYAGYQHDPTLAPSWTLYHVRHRVYNADLGRWNRRDQLGYVDGMSLYEYVRSRPITLADSTGLYTYSVCPKVCDADPYCVNGWDSLYYERAKQLSGHGSPLQHWQSCVTIAKSSPLLPGAICELYGDLRIDRPLKGALPDRFRIYIPLIFTCADEPLWFPVGEVQNPAVPDKVYPGCVCRCMGNGAWENRIRACLRCMVARGVDIVKAHELCMDDENGFGLSYPQKAKVFSCIRKCQHLPKKKHRPKKTRPTP